MITGLRQSHISHYISSIYFNFQDVSLLEEDIIFESNVFDWLECGISCLETRSCAGYNFKESSADGQINCQLTDNADQTFGGVSTEDNDWTFYKRKGEETVHVRRYFTTFI